MPVTVEEAALPIDLRLYLDLGLGAWARNRHGPWPLIDNCGGGLYMVGVYDPAEDAISWLCDNLLPRGVALLMLAVHRLDASRFDWEPCTSADPANPFGVVEG